MVKFTVKNLKFKYKNSEKIIFENISIDINQGEFLCILGKSGCGKSTFLRLLSGLEMPTCGSIYYEEKEIKKASLDRAVVFQDYGLFPWMTAGDNILLALRQKYKKEKKHNLKNLAIEMIKKVGLDESVYKLLPKELSGGMKQRCAIAQSLAVDPPVLLMDEPFGALDAVTRVKLQDLVLDLLSKNTEKKTLIFVTHDVDEALFLADRIIVLGQVPSSIIFDENISNIKGNEKLDRKKVFENTNILKLRNDLISIINNDINKKI